jgi:hypothetical protein
MLRVCHVNEVAHNIATKKTDKHRQVCNYCHYAIDMMVKLDRDLCNVLFE